MSRHEDDFDPDTAHPTGNLLTATPDEERSIITAPNILLELDDYMPPEALPDETLSSGIALSHVRGEHVVELTMPNVLDDGTVDTEHEVRVKIPIDSFINLTSNALIAFSLRRPEEAIHLEIAHRPSDPFAGAGPDDPDDPDAPEETQGERGLHSLFAGSTPIRG